VLFRDRAVQHDTPDARAFATSSARPGRRACPAATTWPAACAAVPVPSLSRGRSASGGSDAVDPGVPDHRDPV